MSDATLTPELIRAALTTVKYPGFSRDIVSFGLVKNVTVSPASNISMTREKNSSFGTTRLFTASFFIEYGTVRQSGSGIVRQTFQMIEPDLGYHIGHKGARHVGHFIVIIESRRQGWLDGTYSLQR